MVDQLRTPSGAQDWHPETALPSAPAPESVFRNSSVEVITGRSNPELARSIGLILGQTVDESVDIFPDRELNIQIHPNLRRKEVFIVQPTSDPVDTNLMEVMLLAFAAKKASSGDVTAVMPYYGYARQDRKDRPRVPISASDIARLLVAAGVDRIFTLDLHSEQTMGAITKPWDNLYGSRVLLPEIRELGTENLVVASADVGGAKKAEKMSLLLDGSGDIAIVHKRRQGGEVKAKAVIGDVEGRDVLVVDDMIDTAGTLSDGARLLKEHGASRIYVAVTHGLFNGPALERISEAPIDQVLVTNTIRQREEVRNHPKIKIVSVAGLVAEGIRRIHTGESLSELIPMPPKSS